MTHVVHNGPSPFHTAPAVDVAVAGGIQGGQPTHVESSVELEEGRPWQDLRQGHHDDGHSPGDHVHSCHHGQAVEQPTTGGCLRAPIGVVIVACEEVRI